jgi:hypothetical protein
MKSRFRISTAIPIKIAKTFCSSILSSINFADSASCWPSFGNNWRQLLYRYNLWKVKLLLLLVRRLACDFSKWILDLLKLPEVRKDCHVCNEQKRFMITWVYSREKFTEKLRLRNTAISRGLFHWGWWSRRDKSFSDTIRVSSRTWRVSYHLAGVLL